MKHFWRVKILAVFLISAAPLAAGEISLIYLPQARMEYEGTGYRQTTNGWELKVKPKSSGAGLRWRHSLSGNLSTQVQYWRNEPFYAREDGNSLSVTHRQTGQTKLAVQWFMADLRRPLAQSPVEAVAGLQGIDESFRRKNIVFNQAAEAGSAHEKIGALGA
jgi:hypothetical protein